jgi:hypothetical protein
MLFQRINRSDSETVFTIVYNIASATITAGYAAVWSIATTVDGVAVAQPATATLSCLVGIAAQDIADSAYGKVQCYGYKASAWVYNNQTTAIAAGDILIPMDSAWHLGREGASDGKSGLVMAAESYATATTSVTAMKKVFIRCL